MCVCVYTHFYSVDPSTTRGSGVLTLCTIENPHITTNSTPYQWFPIDRFNQLWIMYYCSIFLEKIPSISGPAQFKPVLFKGQLYLMWYIYTMGYSVQFSSVA